MIFFTSDEHFNHTNIIKYCNRPFSDANHMNEIIIQRHNEIVGINDTVYHLGDVTFNKDANQFVSRLNGTHHLILGNHDHKSYHKREYVSGYDSVQDVLMVKHREYSFFLSHYSHNVWPKSHRGTFHLFGHSHGTLDQFSVNSMDVGVDTNNFYPYSADKIVRILNK